MPWLKIDDQFCEHPKLLAVGPTAAWLHVCALNYCARHLTDGFLPAEKLSTLVSFDGIAVSGKAVEVGMLVAALRKPCGERAPLWAIVDGGYMIHDYLEYNPSRADVEAERGETRERVRRMRARRREQRNSDECNAVTRENVTPLVTAPPYPSRTRPVPDPVPVPENNSNTNKPAIAAERVVTKPRVGKRSRRRVAYSPEFERTWSVYPRKDAKLAAWEEWQRIRGETPETETVLATSIAAALGWQRQLPHWTRDGGEYIPHFRKYLHNEQWQDERREPVAELPKSLRAFARIATRMEQEGKA